jgi:type IX secretion system PorP/SprF family membrane protein
MDKNNHIDDIFRSKLGDYQPEFVPEHWQMMKAAIASSQKTVPVSSVNFTSKLLIVISALLIISSGVYTYLLTQKYNSFKTIDKTTAQLTPNEKAVKAFNNNRNISESGKTFIPDNNNNNPNQNNYAVKENDVHGNSTVKNISNQREHIQVKKSSSNITNENSTTPTINHNNKTGKTPVNNVEIAALSNQEVTEHSIINEPEQVVTDIISVNTVKPQNTEPIVDSKPINKNNEGIETNKVPNEDNNYSSVTDDYLAQKEKFDKKHKKEMDQKTNSSRKYESLPDCKVSMVNSFIVNPAYAGFNQRHTISLSGLVHKPLYKPSNDFNVPFEYSLGYDFNFGKRRNCGIGIDYKRFLGAAEGSLAVDLTFAYRINLGNYHNLRIGASATYLASDVNKSDLTFPDMIDPRNGFVYNTSEAFPDKTAKNNFDLGMGVWYSWKTLYVGVSAIHITSPEIGVILKSRIPREYLLSAGYGFNINKSVNVLPAFELKYNEKLLNISPSMLFTYKRWLLFGAEFQNLRNAGIVLGVNLKNNVIINIHGGVPMNRDIIKNFGVVDYAGLSLRFQFGNYR